MEFAPLRYAWNAITIWHFVALAAFMAPTTWSYVSGRAPESSVTSEFGGLLFFAFMICWMYFLIAPVMGQIFGDKFSFSAVWPSSIVLGVAMSAAFVTFGFSRGTEVFTTELQGFALIAFVFFSVFLGLALNLFLWLAPRMVGYGVVDFPKLSWGVQV